MAFAFPQAWGGTFYSGTSFTANFGQATVAGNTLLTFITKDDDQVPSTPAPPGWIELYSSQVQGQIWMGAYYKIADGTETAFSSIGDNEIWAVYGFEISGADTTDPITTVGALISGTNSSATVRIPAMVSGSFMFGHIGVDRNRTFGAWGSPDGTEPTDQNVLEGSGAGDVSQLIVGAIYGTVSADFFKGRLLSASDEWGTRSIVVNEPIDTPVISSPTGTPDTTSPSAAQITTPGFTTDITQGTGYWYLSGSGTPPTATDLIAGTGAIQSGSDSVSSTTVTFATITGLSPNTSYFLHYLHQNIVKNSNILSINVSTPAFQITLSFFDELDVYYTGVYTRWKTAYQNTGTAYATITNSLTPPPTNDVINNTNSSWIVRTTDTSWTPSSTPNLVFNQQNSAQGGATIFENTEYYVHAFINDPGVSISDVETHTFTTRHRHTISNIVLVENTIDSLTFDYDVTVNESTFPRVKFILNQSPTALNGSQINSGPNDWTSNFISISPVVDGTLQITATGLDPLTTYYLHVLWYDNTDFDYSTQSLWPVLSPALGAATALNTEEVALTANMGCVIRSTLTYEPVTFGSPARNVTTITEQLVAETNVAAIDPGRNANGSPEELVLTENPASISFGGNRSVTTNTEQILLTEASAVVGQGQTVSGVSEVIVLSESLGTVLQSRNVGTATELLVLTENAGVVTKLVNRNVVGSTESLLLVTTAGIVRKNQRPRLLLTENAATITKDLAFTTALETLVFSSNTGAVEQSRDVFASPESLLVNTLVGAIIRDRQTTTQTETLTLQGNTATVRKDPNVFTVTEQLVLGTQAGGIQKDAFADGVTEELLLAPVAGGIITGRSARGETELLAFAGNSAFITRDRLLLTQTENLVAATNSAVVGRGKTVTGGVEALIAQGTPATIRRDLDIFTGSEAEITVVIESEAFIGRGKTVRTSAERLLLSTNDASFKRGVDVDCAVEELLFAPATVKIGRGVNVVTQTEVIALAANSSAVSKSNDTKVLCATENFIFELQGGTITQARQVSLSPEILLLATASANVQKVLRAEGPGLAFYGKEGIEILPPATQVSVLPAKREGVTVLTPKDH